MNINEQPPAFSVYSSVRSFVRSFVCLVIPSYRGVDSRVQQERVALGREQPLQLRAECVERRWEALGTLLAAMASTARTTRARVQSRR